MTSIEKNIESFLISEFGVEDLLFWNVVQEYKETEFIKPEELLQQVQTIYNDFIEIHSMNEININAPLRNKIKRKIEERDCDKLIFDEVQQEAYYQMSIDSFPRFVRTEWFQNLLRERESARNTIEELQSINLL